MLRGKVDPKKEEQDRLQNLLLDMLKDEENKYCADCQTKTPRWAAWNLGVFICIRCAGIHRNLGVHISKVKSVNLDSWTPEQVQTMRVMGNEKGRRVYEHDLPEHFRRPNTDTQMEQFIRGKYEQKRYALRDFVYPRVDVNDLPKASNSLGAKKAPGAVSVNLTGMPPSRGNNASNSSSTSTPATVNDLLDFSASSAPDENSSATPVGTLMDDLVGLSIAQNPASEFGAACESSTSADFDDFGSFVSAAPVNVSAASPSVQGFANFDSPAATTGTAGLSPANGDAKRSNADILSLFGTSGGGSLGGAQGGIAGGVAPLLVAPGGFTAFGIQAAPNQPQPYMANMGGVHQQPTSQFDAFGALGGINFNAPAPQMSSMGHAMNMGFNIPAATGTSAVNSMHFQHAQIGAMTPSTFGMKAGLPSPTSASSFNTPHTASNAFADLALGKVMKTSYGQNAIQPSSQPAPSMKPNHNVPAASNNVSHMDLFGDFTTPPSIGSSTTTATAVSTNFDDLLGL